MKDKDIKLNQKLTDACSSLSFYTDNPYFVEPMDFNTILKDYKQLKNDADRRSSKITYLLGLVNKTLKANIIRF